jgi:hypothetical protein
VSVRHQAEAGSRRPLFALALLLGALLALSIPTLASAADFKVTGTGDGTTASACETSVGECTLRGAVAAANANADLDEITFSPSFDGGAGSKISLGSTLVVSTPVEILDSAPGGAPDATIHSSNTAIQLTNTATGSVVEGLGIEASSIEVQILGAIGAKVRDNVISGVPGTLPGAGVEVNPGNVGNTGNLIEGNRIKVPGSFSWGIAIQVGANRIFGNEIEAGGPGVELSGCCYQGVILEGSAAGNQIGGDTPESENVITEFWNGAIWDNTSNHNEIARNRGISTSTNFIYGANVGTPTIVKAYPTKVSGTAEPEAKVRVFATVGESNGGIEGFLGEVTAAGDGTWTAPIATSAVGSHVTATQTVEGGTSQMSAVAAIESEPSSGGGGGGGGSTSGGGTTTTTTPPATPTPITAPAPVRPTVKITKGPKKTSTATTAKFTFKTTNVSGAQFECKLDNAKWATCKSPKSYKALKAKAHTFQVRAKAAGLTSAIAKFKFTITA